MKIQYIGQFDSVLVPDLEREVKQGEILDLESPEEREVGASLLEQKDNWARPKAATPSKASGDTSD